MTRLLLAGAACLTFVLSGAALPAQIFLRPEMKKAMESKPWLPRSASRVALPEPPPPNPSVKILVETCPAKKINGSSGNHEEARYCNVALPEGARIVRVSAKSLPYDQDIHIFGDSVNPESVMQVGSSSDVFLTLHTGDASRETVCRNPSGGLGVYPSSDIVLTCDDLGPLGAGSMLVLKVESTIRPKADGASAFQIYREFLGPIVRIVTIEYQTP